MRTVTIELPQPLHERLSATAQHQHKTAGKPLSERVLEMPGPKDGSNAPR